jgi:hypothetical protein
MNHIQQLSVIIVALFVPLIKTPSPTWAANQWLHFSRSVLSYLAENDGWFFLKPVFLQGFSGDGSSSQGL